MQNSYEDMNTRRSFVTAAPVLLTARASGASDRPAYGLIGTGNRGRLLNTLFQKVGARCAALCDIYAPNLDRARRDSPADVKCFVDYRELLAQAGLDFVVVATPDHQHGPMLLASLGAGKDVYLEKPFSHTLDQNGPLVQAVRKTDRIVQVGMQRRSMAYIAKAEQLVREGKLGAVSEIQASWNMIYHAPLENAPLEGKLDWEKFLGPAPKRPLEPPRFRWWRGFWDYSGGNVTDQGAHLMDVVQRVGGLVRPSSAVCHGVIREAKGAEVPDIFSAVFEYPGVLVTWSLNYCTAFDLDWRIRFLGSEAGMVIDRTGLRVFRTSNGRLTEGAEPVISEKGDFVVELHLQNFLDCIRTRRQPNCPVEVAAAAVAGPHLANLALRSGRQVKLGADGRVSA
jgi:predicted dehydrogenase